MRKKVTSMTMVILFAMFAFALVVPQSATAVISDEKNTHQAGESQERTKQNKLRVCQKHEKKISQSMVRISEKGQKQLAVFTKISERVQKFYIDKGKILENYDALVADVNAKKAEAEATLETIKSDATTFNCDVENSKNHTKSFKENHKTMAEALKEYRTSIKNLIAGVKSVQSTVDSEERGELQ